MDHRPHGRGPGLPVRRLSHTGAALVAALLLALLCVACVRAEVRPEPPPDDGRPKKYVVMLEGRNFIVATGDGIRRLGFLTTRHVEAVSGEAAGERAIREVRRDPEITRRMRNPPDDPLQITVQRLIQVQSFAADSSPELGYIFYADRD